jgi:serpin B
MACHKALGIRAKSPQAVRMTRFFCPLVLGIVATLQAAPPNPAVRAVNALGLDLQRELRQLPGNVCLSPYSVQCALAMTYLGASGATREEMARVLHYGETEIGSALAQLSTELEATRLASEELVKRSRERGGPSEPLQWSVANRLYGQKGYAFRPAFLDQVRRDFGAPLEPLDFIRRAPEAVRQINAWVEQQTRERIRDLIPAGGLDRDTRLVLVNALHFKAAWATEFVASATADLPFHLPGGETVAVPTMRRRDRLGYRSGQDFDMVSVPFVGHDMQLLLLVPRKIDGLAPLEDLLTPETLAACAKLESREVELFLPKFRLESPTLDLSEVLQHLGMSQAFDRPPGSANFDAMAPRRPDDYLHISKVFHKTFLALDERGAEAAAATAVAMVMATSIQIEPEKPVQVRVDRPFLFALQQARTGVCLFLGRLTDPR